MFNEWFVQHSQSVKEQTSNKIKERYKHLNSIKNIRINDLNIDKYKIFNNELRNKNMSADHSNKILNLKFAST